MRGIIPATRHNELARTYHRSRRNELAVEAGKCQYFFYFFFKLNKYK